MFCCVLSLIYYLIYGLLAIFVVLFSALVISEQFRKAFFAWIFTTSRYCDYLKGLFVKHRPLWLKDFTEVKPQISNEKLEVLEIGVGYGANFELYPENCRLTVLDFNDNFKDEFMKNIKMHPKIEFDKYLTASVEDMHLIKDNTYDVVLITHLFCSVGNVQKGLKEVKRVMKKDGKFFFMEHVGYHQESLVNNIWSMVQYALEPLWKIVFCGCHLRKQTWVLIQNAGFKSVDINHSYPENIPGYLRPHIWGSAVK